MRVDLSKKKNKKTIVSVSSFASIYAKYEKSLLIFECSKDETIKHRNGCRRDSYSKILKSNQFAYSFCCSFLLLLVSISLCRFIFSFIFSFCSSSKTFLFSFSQILLFHFCDHKNHKMHNVRLLSFNEYTLRTKWLLIQ